MILSSLKLKNFRNYDDFTLEFEPVTVLVGPNGIGKTNIIEAVYFLSVGKSFRAKKDIDTVLWDKDFASIIGNADQLKLELFINRKPDFFKAFKINSVDKKLAEYFGNLKVVLFSPESIEIITDSPKNRRKFIDLILSQTDYEYLLNLLELQKIIRNRNHLLYGIKIGKNKSDELYFWDNKLFDLTKKIIKKRVKLIKYFNENINEIFLEISGAKDKLSIEYISTIYDLEKFFDLVEKNREREIKEGATIFGPHRDDLKFIINEKEITSFASRGEIRSVVFSLKMCELNYLKHLKFNPIILLDDIFSELDRTRRNKLSNLIINEQAIITSTEKELFTFEKIKPKIMDLKNV